MNQMYRTLRERIAFILNLLLIVFVGIGIYYMFLSKDASGGVLSAEGIYNLKYYTVLSNVFCGAVAIAKPLYEFVTKKAFPIFWKLAAAAEVALTFLIVAAFLQPLYPNLNMYERGNLWFHLLCPLTAMAEFLLLTPRTANGEKTRIPMKATLPAAVVTLLYGIFYLVRIAIEGIGEWPDSNDFYGFLNWGLPVGLIIFAVIILISWLLALLLRFLNHLLNRKS